MNQIENNILFRFLSYLLCLTVVWGYGIFLYLTLFEIEFLSKAFIYSIFLTLGYIWSWMYRYSNQFLVKIILALLMILAAVNFFQNLSQSVYDPRIPLLDLLIILLLLHSFDLPRRKDILYSITSALIVVIVLTVVSLTTWMVPYIIFFTFLFFVTLFVMDSDTDLKNVKIINRISLELTVVVLFISFVLFLFLPKPSGGYFLRFTFAPKNQVANLSNPSYNQNYNKQLQTIFSQSFVYKNFKGEMDLTSRGLLPHVLVMKVKAPFITYIKGIHLIDYDGKKWYNSNNEELNIDIGYYSYFTLPSEFDSYSYNVLNLYYLIVADLPDILYHIPIPGEVFFPASVMKMKDFNFYTEYPLVKGITYTVVTRIPYFDIEMLKEISMDNYQKFWEKIIIKDKRYLRYLDLPDIDNKIKELAYNLTSNYDSFWLKIQKIKEYLEMNYTYDLFIDVPRTEAVYDFLFIQKRGYCEQFASSLAVMLRSIGIPCRVVIGYLPQKMNIFTGFIEVYSDDAHSWVEVLTPWGWIPVDPSPSNVDILTIKYLQSKNEQTSLLGIYNLDQESIKSIFLFFNIVLRITFLFIAILVLYNLYLVIRKKYLFEYLKNLNIEQIDYNSLSRIYSIFIEYFRSKNIVFRNSLTLREMKRENIEDHLYPKFQKFLDIYERFLYGP